MSDVTHLPREPRPPIAQETSDPLYVVYTTRASFAGFPCSSRAATAL
ncbi:MAG: hypothetical protein QOG44_1112, partial [Acidimicrobiaceae bacterium]|nr:hypothetical protein [Acidimicrobiaceae bacterium]